MHGFSHPIDGTPINVNYVILHRTAKQDEKLTQKNQGDEFIMIYGQRGHRHLGVWQIY